MGSFYVDVLRVDPSLKRSEYVSVDRFLRRLWRRGSVGTIRLYLKALAWFVGWCELSPDEVVKLPPDEVEELVQRFCDGYAARGRRGAASNYLKALKSFLKANEFEGLNLEDYKHMRRPEYVPTKEEVYRMVESAGSLKWRAVILCLFQSGLRNSALRALTYGMVRDQVESGEIPIKIHVTSELRKIIPDACKEGVEYWTFLAREASEALRAYLEERRRIYGKIEDDELLFPSESRTLPRRERVRTPMSQWHLVRIVRNAARRAGIKEWKLIRAHSLRKTFRAVLDAGYVDGGQMAEDDKEYLMGHKLPSQKAPYHNANVDVLAQRYMKLRWSREAELSKEAKIEAIKAFARSLGIKEIEVRIAKLREAEPEITEEEAVGRVIREELIKSLKVGSQKVREKGDPKKIVNEDELEKYLAEGWDIQTILPSGRILIRRPT